MKSSLPVVKYSPGVQLLYVIIGCLPAISTIGISLYLVYNDYAINNYSFWAKNWHLSNTYETSYDANVTCIDSDYIADRQKYPSCAPKNCFRYFTDFLISENEAKALLSLAERGWSQGDESDSVISLNVETGVVSKGGADVKIKENFYSKEDLAVYNNVKQKILNHVKEKFNAQNLHLTNKNLFSKFSNSPAKSSSLEYWHSSVDKYTQKNVQYSAILFFNNFMGDFFGGRFVFKNTDNTTVLSVQPKTARVMVYSPGSENENYYERLEYGNSYFLTIPLTCNPQQ